MRKIQQDFVETSPLSLIRYQYIFSALSLPADDGSQFALIVWSLLIIPLQPLKIGSKFLEITHHAGHLYSGTTWFLYDFECMPEPGMASDLDFMGWYCDIRDLEFQALEIGQEDHLCKNKHISQSMKVKSNRCIQPAF